MLLLKSHDPAMLQAIAPAKRFTGELEAMALEGKIGGEKAELVGKAVILTNGKSGTVDRLWLEELHGLRISIESNDGNWPVATIKFAEK
jgi:hypothetical protein